MRIGESPKDCIRTNSGIYMNVFEPKASMVNINDIAHALSFMPRFGGHLNRFYSVAQHSLLCVNLATSIEDKKTMLMHDASEAYMLDIPTPIKNRLPEYKKYEATLMKLISFKFGFDFPMNETLMGVDAEALNIEWENMVVTNNTDFICMTSEEAKKAFLDKFNELFD
jgi:5'-deoxynucleotidase YfbR-like HD superfamily hydrolase